MHYNYLILIIIVIYNNIFILCIIIKLMYTYMLLWWQLLCFPRYRKRTRRSICTHSHRLQNIAPRLFELYSLSVLFYGCLKYKITIYIWLFWGCTGRQMPKQIIHWSSTYNPQSMFVCVSTKFNPSGQQRHNTVMTAVIFYLILYIFVVVN